MASRVIDVTMQLIDKVTQPLSGINSNLKDSSRQWQNAGKNIIRTGENITKAGETMTKNVTMPILGLGAGAVKTAMTFDAGMSKVQAISGLSGEQMEKMTEKAKEMGAKTKFSATEAADAFSYMAMAGWKDAQMLAGIENVMYLAGATGEDLAQTSDIVTDAMTAFNMTAGETQTVLRDGVETELENTQRFVDVLAATANNSNTNVSMLGESFKYVAPIAGAMNYSIEDISVALGLMANSGIKASNSGTALRSIITRMAKPTKESANAMNELNLSLQNEDGTMKSFMEIMEDMRDGFPALKMSASEFNDQMAELDKAFEAGELTEKEYGESQDHLMEMAYGAEGALKAQYAAMLAGKTGMSGLMAIVNASDSDFEQLSNAINNSNGACENMYNITQDNLLGRLTILKSTIESIAISFGQDLSPMVEKATSFFQSLGDKLNALGPEEREQIIKIAGIAAAIGPALLVFGKLVTGIGKVVLVIGKIGGAISKAGGVMAALATPGGIVVAVLVAIGVAIYLVVKYWDEIKAAAQVAMDFIVNAVTSIKDAITSKFEECGVTMEYLKEKLEPIKEKFSQLGEKIMNIWTTYIQPAWENFKQIVSDVWDFIQPILQKLIDLVVDIFETQFSATIDYAISVFKFWYDEICNYIDMVLGVLNGLIDFIVGVFTGDWELAWNGVLEIFNSIVEGIKNAFQGAIDFISGLISGIADKISGLFEKLHSLMNDANNADPGHNAVGTSYWRGGTTWVHERGAEIIDLPRGSRIYPHSESLKMAYNQGRAEGNSQGGNISINIPKLADNITVRSDSDIEAIASAIANKLEQVAQNTGGGQLGYVY